MDAGTLQGISVRATRAPARQLAATQEAAASGDASWRQWLEEEARGEALLLSLHVTAHYALPDRDGRVALVNEGVWAENSAHPPLVEDQVRELVFKDVALLSAQLSEQGVMVGEDELARMYVHVELAPDVRAALGPGGDRHAGPALGPGLASWVERDR